MSLTNAKEEFVECIRLQDVKCANITRNDGWGNDSVINYSLRVGHTPEELDEFLNSINFKYDSGYGGQELFGVVWMTDGTWFTRGEYDGSEWWEHHAVPEIPKELT
jgi:hypothetical protein